MKYALVNNNEIAAYDEPQVILKLIVRQNPEIVFPTKLPDQNWLSRYNVFQVIDDLPFDSNTHKLEFVAPYIQDGKVYSARVVPHTAEDLALRAENTLREKVMAQRFHRDRLLKASDIYMLQDIFNGLTTAEQQAWSTYRQQLRDLPAQAGFALGTVSFPSPPRSLGVYDN